MNAKHLSKYMSLVLRHQPELSKLDMDDNGWVSIDQLITNANLYNNIVMSRDELQEVVDTNDKKRFLISDDGLRIRASQGHSIKIDLAIESKTPPDILYHGTATRFLSSINAEGLKPMQRQHVHLSSNMNTAISVGQRHGIPVVLTIDAKKMYEDGFKFYISDNGVWLTDTVPVQYF